ncbi:uncharacterized protein LOC126662172 [Mercurialis annua]|uniref:uncharacterized protein LOC126662172 n=1 Tax=Mercurialis annua TaxID=3986 RepID=UPI002160B3B0|nr:uncharacterized protein LOC126662172 [Mercurialis annua]
MSTSMRFICALLLLSLVTQGNCICSTVSDFLFSQTTTGKKIGNNVQYKMIIKNDCSCARSDIKLDCHGFSSIEKIDPAILKINGDECLLINGGILHAFESVSFTYTSDKLLQTRAIESTLACP